ncbi:MAG: outer membrane beta-barrel protein [Pseudomonadota bacterium]|nr:outer membrane beta-barrel protein [Pseudomonadota bacterium]
MKVRLHSAVRVLALTVLATAAAGASAQSAGQWTAKVGLGTITPKVESGNISAPALPNSKADVGPDTKPLFVFGYSFTDNIAAELDLGVPFKHTLYGADGIAGTGKLGTVESLPPTAFVQYRFFTPDTKFRPYVGVGVTYAYFQKAEGSGQMTALTNVGSSVPTTFKVKNKAAGSVQLGVAYNVNDKWFVDFTLVKTFLKTKVNFSTGQSQDIRLNPQTIALGVGYKF